MINWNSELKADYERFAKTPRGEQLIKNLSREVWVEFIFVKLGEELVGEKVRVTRVNEDDYEDLVLGEELTIKSVSSRPYLLNPSYRDYAFKLVEYDYETEIQDGFMSKTEQPPYFEFVRFEELKEIASERNARNN
jgi:hypothetical protein